METAAFARRWVDRWGHALTQGGIARASLAFGACALRGPAQDGPQFTMSASPEIHSATRQVEPPAASRNSAAPSDTR